MTAAENWKSRRVGSAERELCAERSVQGLGSTLDGIRRAIGAFNARANAGDLINWVEPVHVGGHLAAHGVKVELRQLARDGADLAVSDLAVVDVNDRRKLRAGAAQERLVTRVQLASIDRAHDGLEAHLLARELHQRGA